MIIALTALLLVQADSGRAIEVWTRPTGTFDRGAEPARAGAVVIDLETVPAIEKTMYDVQLESTRAFRGLTLSSLIEARTIGSGVDTALLHFANGMIVPVLLDASKNVFIAASIRSPAGEWERAFPEVTKRRAVLPDPRPIAFGANKIVVTDAPEMFSPWQHVDTLVGVELVRGAAYEAQFGIGDKAEIQPGARVFLKRCHFCHAVRDVGATFGWDLVDPVPVYTYRTTQTLHAHVKYENADALELGYMMPVQRDIERTEIDALLAWLKRVAKHGLKPYEP
jgi:hypothetical protein